MKEAVDMMATDEEKKTAVYYALERGNGSVAINILETAGRFEKSQCGYENIHSLVLRGEKEAVKKEFFSGLSTSSIEDVTR